MLKILQGRLQQDVNWELPDVQAGFWRGRGTRDQIACIHWILEKAQKNIYFYFIDYTKPLCESQQTSTILNEMRIQDNLTVSCETCMWVKKQQLEP